MKSQNKYGATPYRPVPLFLLSKDSLNSRVKLFCETQECLKKLKNLQRQDTPSVWYSRDYLSSIMAEVSKCQVDGIKIYFDEYGDDANEKKYCKTDTLLVCAQPTTRLTEVRSYGLTLYLDLKVNQVAAKGHESRPIESKYDCHATYPQRNGVTGVKYFSFVAEKKEKKTNPTFLEKVKSSPSSVFGRVCTDQSTFKRLVSENSEPAFLRYEVARPNIKASSDRQFVNYEYKSINPSFAGGKIIM